MNILFLTWDGPQVNYLESLFIPIFSNLQVNYNINIHIMQFTWQDRSYEKKGNIQQICKNNNIKYTALNINRTIPIIGQFITVYRGALLLKKYIVKNNIDVIMPRSIMPAIITLKASPRLKNIKILFDADGLALDERIDFAGWSHSNIMYRYLRDAEALAVVKADTVIVRSSKAIDILVARAGARIDKRKIFVVSNGRDQNLFKPLSYKQWLDKRQDLGISEDCPLIVYAGSAGDQYCFNEMLLFFSEVKKIRDDARMLILTMNIEYAKQILNNIKAEIAKDVILDTIPYNEIPYYLGIADLGLAFRTPTFSMQAVSPIKLGEYLLCGVPVVSTKGIGDTELYITEKKCGYLVEDLNEESLKKMASWFIYEYLPNKEIYKENSREIGEKYFSLDSSIKSYIDAINHTAAKI
jgi:hypothetical protein